MDRTRKLLRTNLPIIKEWADLSGFFNFVKPKAGAITFMRYDSKTKSVELANKLREKKNVLVAPGKHFGVEGYLRIGYGAEPDYLKAGLSLIDEYIQESHVG